MTRVETSEQNDNKKQVWAYSQNQEVTANNEQAKRRAGNTGRQKYRNQQS